MATSSLEFISLMGIGDVTVCRSIAQSLITAFKKINEDKRMVNYSIRIIENADGAEEELIDPKSIEAHTMGSYPVVWGNLTFDPNQLQPEVFKRWAADFQLTIVNKGTWDGLNLMSLDPPPKSF